MKLDITQAFLPMLIGCILLLVRKPYARYIIDYQNRVMGYHFGEKVIRRGEILIGLAGIVFLAIGFAVVVACIVGV